ncbi:MAG: hypothetical protein JXA77_15010 [Bacteroidales bacterium]|nr:hypothetical protein [Bacteroidales bacterium]MBN2818921.1 hypothetical protein [Bacteroidales bacterium]
MKNYILFAFALFSAMACEINQKDIHPESSFIKIYNNPSEQLAYYPTGIIQTDDRGFLILSGLKNDSSLFEYPSAVIIKTSETGELDWTTETQYLAPANGFIEINGQYMFAAMDGQNNGYILQVNPTTGDISRADLNLTMPLAIFKDSKEQLVVLGYDFVSRSSTLSLFNSSLKYLSGSALTVNSDMMPQIQAHMNKTGTEFPFFIGEWINASESGYYANCMANYTLRTVFFNNNASPTGGDIYSFQARDAISSLVHKEGTSFAFTRYYGGHNYIASDMNININASQNFNDFTQHQLYDLVPNAKVVARKVVFDGSESMLFAGTTNSNSVAIYQYDTTGVEPIFTYYTDFADKIEISDMMQDGNDEGIVLLVKLYFTGRYLRPAVIKIEKENFI